LIIISGLTKQIEKHCCQKCGHRQAEDEKKCPNCGNELLDRRCAIDGNLVGIQAQCMRYLY